MRVKELGTVDGDGIERADAPEQYCNASQDCGEVEGKGSSRSSEDTEEVRWSRDSCERA